MESSHSLPLLKEEISLILSQWQALQAAILNRWGGIESNQKYEGLAATLFSYLSQSRGPLHIEDLENILDENMVLSFNTEIEDGSIEQAFLLSHLIFYQERSYHIGTGKLLRFNTLQVAEQLMITYEECLHGNYESVEKLR